MPSPGFEPKTYSTAVSVTNREPASVNARRTIVRLSRLVVTLVALDSRCIFQRTIDKYSACVEVGKPIDENSACVEVGTTHKHLRRGDNSNNFKNYFSSNDITCEEVKSVESTFLLDTSYVRATREPEKKVGSF
ncbi:hypothetical protein TNCV_37341 [Trichonephila clavipes]|nr:hypothetical protein TNCV_37341 [Trichonephila clavipes]